MDDIRKEPVHTTDGRKGDKVVTQSLTDSGEKKTITELYVEPKIEKKLAQRVVEFERPVVHRREIETVDEATGNIVDKKVESIDPDVQMQLREHIAVQHSVKTQSVDDCDCHVTKEELQEGLVTLAKTLAEAMKPAAPAEEKYEPVVKLSPKDVNKMKKSRVSVAQAALADKFEAAKPKGNILWWGLIGVEAAALVYMFGWM